MIRLDFLRSIAALQIASNALPVSTSSPLLTPEMRSDIEFLVATLYDISPDPFLAASRKEFEAKHAAALAELSAPHTAAEFFVLAASLLASLHDSHSRIEWTYFFERARTGERILFPVFTSASKGQLYVNGGVAAGATIPPGSRIVSVNGIAVTELLEAANSLVGAQNPNLLAVLVHYSDYISMKLGDSGNFDVSYVTHDQQSTTIRIPAVTSGEIRSEMSARRALLDQAASGPYVYRHIVARNVGLLTYRACVDREKMSAFCDATFRRLQNERPKALVIDIRDNDGGDSEVNDILLDFITDKSYAQFGNTICRSNQFLKNEYGREKYITVYGREAWDASEGALITSSGPNLITPGVNLLRYRGPVYVLIGPGTFSSAVDFASAIKDYGLGKLVGEATAEPVVATGEIYETLLPLSKLAVTFSTKVFYGPKYHPPGQGITPDQTIETTIEDRVGGKDPVLPAVLAVIDCDVAD